MSVADHMPPRDEPWHLSKSVSVGTIWSIILILAGGIFSYASLRAQVDDKVDKEQVIRIEERQKALQEDVDEIKEQVKVLPEIQSDLSTLVRELELERRARENGDYRGERDDS